MFFYDVLLIRVTTAVDTPLSWVQSLKTPVFEVSSRVNMMFENPKVMDSVQQYYHIYHEIISDIK